MVDKLPVHLNVITAGFCLDGGSLTLHCTDEAAEPRRVYLMQQLTGGSGPIRRQFGLFFDGEAVPRESQAERDLGSLLRAAAADIQDRPVDADPIDLPNEPSSGRMLIIGKDIEAYLKSTPRGFTLRAIREIINYIDTPHLDATRT